MRCWRTITTAGWAPSRTSGRTSVRPWSRTCGTTGIRITFGTGAETTTRFFPDKLPVGVPRKGGRRHVFLYLATREVPIDFRMFLLRHADLLKSVDEWTIRVLLPRRFRKAAALYRYAVRDAFLLPLTPQQTEELDWYFRARRGEVACPARDRDLDLATAARKFSAARFEALYRMWLQRDAQVLWAMQGTTLRDQLQRGEGRVEFAELPHQYLQLTPLVGVPGGVEKGLPEGRQPNHRVGCPRPFWRSRLRPIRQRRCVTHQTFPDGEPRQTLIGNVAAIGRRFLPPVRTPRRR